MLENSDFCWDQCAENAQVPTKIPRIVFSRTETRATAPLVALPQFEALWRKIDETELILNFYELAHSKRTNPPRSELLARFTFEELEALRQRASALTMRTYLKQKHLLVELRQSQFHLKDSYTVQILNRGITPVSQPDQPFASNLLIEWAPSLFTPGHLPLPSDFTHPLDDAIHAYWLFAQSDHAIDFTNTTQVYAMLCSYTELIDARDKALARNDPSSQLPAIINTLHYYLRLTPLPPPYEQILRLKLSKVRNAEIARAVNSTHNTSYGENYISTIFTQKIVPAICATASLHELHIQNLLDPENWKNCKKCGRTLLRCKENFVKQARTSDGFAYACKHCQSRKVFVFWNGSAIPKNKEEDKNEQSN